MMILFGVTAAETEISSIFKAILILIFIGSAIGAYVATLRMKMRSKYVTRSDVESVVRSLIEGGTKVRLKKAKSEAPRLRGEGGHGLKGDLGRDVTRAAQVI